MVCNRLTYFAISFSRLRVFLTHQPAPSLRLTGSPEAVLLPSSETSCAADAVGGSVTHDVSRSPPAQRWKEENPNAGGEQGEEEGLQQQEDPRCVCLLTADLRDELFFFFRDVLLLRESPLV